MFGSAPLASEGFGVLADGFRVWGGGGRRRGGSQARRPQEVAKAKNGKKKEEEKIFLPGFHVKVC